MPLLLRSGDTAQEAYWAPEGGGVNRPVCFSLCKELGERPTLHELYRTDRGGLFGLAGVAVCEDVYRVRQRDSLLLTVFLYSAAVR